MILYRVDGHKKKFSNGFEQKTVFNHFISPQQMRRPMPWAECFGRKAPLEIEIGFGNGEYLLKNALQAPENDFVGFELNRNRIKNTLRQCELNNNIPSGRRGCHNVRLLYVDAEFALSRMFVPATVAKMHCLFPCPWPKTKHIRHRLFSQDFLRLVNSRLIMEGELLIVTDSQEYYSWIQKQIPGTGFYSESKIVPARFNTKFERKWSAAGQSSFYELILKKFQHCDIPLVEDIPLSTFRLKGFAPDHFNVQNEVAESAVIFKGFEFDSNKRKGTAQFVVSEQPLVQILKVNISYEHGDWVVSINKDHEMIPTMGVKRALEIVYQAGEKSIELRNA